MAGCALKVPVQLDQRQIARLAALLTSSAAARTKYVFTCRDRHGRIKWQDDFFNLVTTAGLNKLLDATFKTGLASPAWYVGLKDVGLAVAADTMGSHASWAELTGYSNANRPTFTPGTISAGAVDNSASVAAFNINSVDQVFGAFLADNNTKGGTTGTLYGVGDFAAGTITGATQANPVVITSAAHGLSNGQTVRIASVGGMTEINNRDFTVASADTNTFALAGEDGTGHTAYTSGGRWSKFRTVEDGDTLSVTITLSLTSS